MTPQQFTIKYLPFAKLTEEKSGISAIAILAQAALESGWGEHAPGNMFFGVKDRDGMNGNEQLLQTTEYSQRSDLKFPVIISVTPVTRNGLKYYMYKVKDYFRKYDTPEESFTDHANLFLRVKRYAKALTVKDDPIQFLTEVAKAGYATDPGYADKLAKIVEMIQKYA
jgi:flagellum-specific peptidoglycan hydrolase FlgJ